MAERLVREDLRGKVQTVRGLIAPDRLGATLMHEHVICDITPPELRGREAAAPITIENRFAIDYGREIHTGKYKLQDVAVAVDELGRMKRAGGNTIVDLTCGGLSPDPERLREISALSGVNIVMGCGHYVEAFQDPGNHARTVEDFAREMIDQVCAGAWGTDVRAGILGEIGCQVPWTKLERRVMAGAVLAQQQTGAALSIHPGADPDQPQEIIDVVRAHGGCVERTIMGHVDRTIFDEDRLLRLAGTGCMVELDLFGYESAYWPLGDIDMPNDGGRIRLLATLLRRGHVGQILISHDICRLTRYAVFGGHGYGHIFRNVVPLLLRRGFSEADVDTILRDNPRRLLTFV